MSNPTAPPLASISATRPSRWMYAFIRLGFLDEAGSFMHWIWSRITPHLNEQSHLQLMYRVDGSAELAETSIDD